MAALTFSWSGIRLALNPVTYTPEAVDDELECLLLGAVEVLEEVAKRSTPGSRQVAGHTQQLALRAATGLLRALQLLHGVDPSQVRKNP